MRIIVIGPTLLTKNCVRTLAEMKKDDIVAIYTLNDSAGQEKSRFTLMDDICKENAIPLFKINNVNDRSVIEQIKKQSPDIILELGWSQIISPEIIKIPKKGCIGVHASLLPKNRGAASLNWAIINDMKETGVTLFYLSEKPDEGDVIAQKSFAVDDRDDINTLHSKSDLASVELLVENIDYIRNDTVERKKQKKEEITYTKRRKPDDGVIDWCKTSREVYNWIRAQTHPFPGAFTFFNRKKIYVWASALTDMAHNGTPGQVFEVRKKEGIFVVTGDGLIILKRLQFLNGIEMWADDFAYRYNIKQGDIFE